MPQPTTFWLPALAHYRRARGKPCLSVNWGPWAEIGIAATEYGRLGSTGVWRHLG